MPYALTNLRDKQPPGFRFIGHPSEALAEEIVVDSPPEPGLIWDEAAQKLRPLTTKEIKDEEFETAKYDKLVEFFTTALEKVVEKVPEAKGTYERVPKELLDQAEVAHFLAVAEDKAGDPSKLYQMMQVLGRLRMRREQVAAMTPENTTLEDLKAEKWEE